MNIIPDLSLTGPTARVVIVAALLAALLLMARPPAGVDARRWFTGAFAVTAAMAWIVVGGIWVMLELAWRPFPEPVPAAMYLASGVALHVALLAVVKPLLGRRRQLAWTLPVALVAVVAALLQANVTYQLYPTVGALDPLAGPEEVAYERLGDPGLRRAPRDGGVLTSVHLDNPASGFEARDAQVYLPPAYFANPRPALPVVVLVAGVPGSPQQWFAEGRAGESLDAFAADHRGSAPIVVAVDANGSPFKDTLCVDSPTTGDKVMTYLAKDVPASVAKLFDVDEDPAKWAIGGLSRGGSCALQMALSHPGTYPTFLSMSPQQRPVDENPAQTVAKYFGGDAKAYAAVDPLEMLKTGRFDAEPRLAGRLIAGLDDSEDRDAGHELTAAAHSAGIDVTYSELPGAHTWRVWSTGFAESIPWLSARLGLTGEDP
ncbi:alpha/beta hydrolase family protein [uncultured Corynebacterium sp.]|uniref:alpha/beta hydrolase n=1 Tax=uncultured Corynebacterium sp. TaxID=159447 RepID=UPI0025F40F90|nr:alpha/beta hydrolase-fold protein [uncultured Corynebacterium sp.]